MNTTQTIKDSLEGKIQQLLQGDVAVVTGGTAGIGRAIAVKFAEQGADVIIFGRNVERGQKVVEEMKALAPETNPQFIAVDVAEQNEVQEAVKTVLDQYGKVDILVNNAGITRDTILMKMKEDDWNSVIQTNLTSLYNTCQVLARPMMRARKGKIINVSSVSGLTGNVGQVNYSSSKAGVIGFTKALAKELATRNICVNCIAPGFIDTDMTTAIPENARSKLIEGVPMQRMGEPLEIAFTALFLASPLSSYITGQVLTVDGGMVM